MYKVFIIASLIIVSTLCEQVFMPTVLPPKDSQKHKEDFDNHGNPHNGNPISVNTLQDNPISDSIASSIPFHGIFSDPQDKYQLRGDFDHVELEDQDPVPPKLTGIHQTTTTSTTATTTEASGLLAIKIIKQDGQTLTYKNDELGSDLGLFMEERDKKIQAPFGSWKSPITSGMVTTSHSSVVEAPFVDPVTGRVFWVERKPDEEGRDSIHHYDPETEEIVRWTPNTPEWNVKSTVHEYGGGSFTVYNNTLFFVSYPDNNIFRQEAPDQAPKKLTKSKYRRYADGSYSPQLDALFYVVEDHDLMITANATEPQNGIIKVCAKTGKESVVVAHADFFASPRVSPDGLSLTWVKWNHPAMPWGDTRMFVAKLKTNISSMAIEKYFQHGSMMIPKWSPNNELLYVHDTTGWWNVYIVNKRGHEINLTPFQQECGWPAWQFRLQAFDVNPRVGTREVVAICGKDLYLINSQTQERRILDTGYDSYKLGVSFSIDGKKVYVIAGSKSKFPALVEVDITTGAVKQIRHTPTPVNDSYISLPKHIQFPTTLGDFAYGYLYYPENGEYSSPDDGSQPPLLVQTHQGPTSAASNTLNLNYQYFTSRGFMLLDVDHRGSTGYGKLYRSQLHERWGVLDRADVEAGANYLVKKGLVDQEKLCISGHSAGGFTALASLTFSNVFKAGASYYGISDLELLAKDTHKFESHYLDYLIGGLPDKLDRYIARSPIHHYNKLNTSVIFFHGALDKVVPPSQAKKMYDVVKKKGLPTAYVLFPEESHGFAKTKNLKKSLETEFAFYAKVFNFASTDVTSDVVIENLEQWRQLNQIQNLTKVTQLTLI